jgi:hypothetical protein
VSDRAIDRADSLDDELAVAMTLRAIALEYVEPLKCGVRRRDREYAWDHHAPSYAF